MARNPPQSKSPGSQAAVHELYHSLREEFLDLSRQVQLLRTYDDLVNAVGHGFVTLNEELRAGRASRITPLRQEDEALLAALRATLARPDWTEATRLPVQQLGFPGIGQDIEQSQQPSPVGSKGP
jgi:hypothetical protein